MDTSPKSNIETALNFFQARETFWNSRYELWETIETSLDLWGKGIDLNFGLGGDFRLKYSEGREHFAEINVWDDGSLILVFTYEDHLFEPFAEALRKSGFIVHSD